MKRKWIYAILKREIWHLRSFLTTAQLLFLFLFLSITLSANIISQNEMISIKLKNASLIDILKEISDKSGYDFLYNYDLLQSKGQFQVDENDIKINELLNKLLLPVDLTYELKDNLIVLRENRIPQSTEKKTIKITGVVRDKQKNTLPGVAVILKGTTIGVSSDIDGNFTLNIPETEEIVLVFQFVGMKTQELKYKGEKALNIVLEEDIQEMGEVVVTGLFNRAKESYTGAVTTITAKELERAGSRSVISSIRNIDPSFNVMENIQFGSDPNKMPDINIRGDSSFDVNVKDIQNDSRNEIKSNMPLFIMDGFEVKLERIMDMDENQIETITILKDASATSMYGTRGANGVVVVTTKKPEPGKLRLTYKGSLNIEAPDLTSYHLTNAFEKLEFEQMAGLYFSESAVIGEDLKDLYNKRLLNAQRGVNTYWLKYPVRNAYGNKHSIRIEGGDEILRFYAGLSYNNIEGTMKGSDRNTFNGNIFVAYRLNRVTFQNDLQVSVNKSNNSPYGTFTDFAEINPYYTPYDEEGNIVKILENYYYTNLSTTGRTYNPLYNALLPTIDESRYFKVQNNFAIEAFFNDDLFLRAQLGISKETNRSDYYLSSKHTSFDEYAEADYGRRGTYEYTTGEKFSYESDITLNFSKLLENKHQIYSVLGLSLGEDSYERFTIKAEGISNPKMDFLGMASSYEKDGSPSGYEGKSRRLGGLLNINYTYDRKYFVDFSGKLEGSSKFGSDNRIAPFWVAGMGWNAHNEEFFQANGIVNALRLRFSYGTSGSQDFDPYQAMTTFRDYGNSNYKGWNGVYLIGMGNSDLGWQKTRQLNFGTEFELFNNRLKFNIDIYKKITDDLLSDITIPTSSGFSSYKANIGKVENRGFELYFNAYLIRNTDSGIIFSVGGNMIHNKNEIKKISNSLEFLNDEILKEDSSNPSFLYKEGQSMKTIFTVKSLGIDPANGNEIFVKQDGTLTYTWDAKDKVACGVNEAKYKGTFNTLFRYKNFTFNTIFAYQWGGQKYNQTLVDRVENVKYYKNVDKRALYDRWQKPGDKVFFKAINNLSNTKSSSRFVMDDNILECRTITLTYDIYHDWLKNNLGISYVSLSAQTEDVFRVSTIKLERGLDYPFSRKFSFSLTARF